MTKYYTVYTNWLAVALREEGFKIAEVKVNSRHPQYDCYSFKNSQELQDAIHRLTREKRNKVVPTKEEV